MKMRPTAKRAFYALTVSVMLFASCQKEETISTDATSDPTTVAVAATASAALSHTAAGTDSVYLLQTCRRDEKRDSIAQTDLPATVSSYVASNYAGAIYHKAFAVKSSGAVLTGYVVVIYYNDKPAGLLFDSAGNFVKVLEQREKGDLHGAGHRRGGRFEHRDGKQRDTIALTALPSAITGYFAANYASDTLLKAFRNRDSSLVVLSKNAGVYATVFDANNSFVKREQLPPKSGRVQAIELAQLPSIAAHYLAQTYPNYVFKKAFSISQNGTVRGYVVLIDANNTKYAVGFDAAGNFVKAKTIR